MYGHACIDCITYAWDDSKTWLQHKNPSNITNNASIPKIFGVLKSWVFALSLRNNVSTLCCVCILQDITSFQKSLFFLTNAGSSIPDWDCKSQISLRNIDMYPRRIGETINQCSRRILTKYELHRTSIRIHACMQISISPKPGVQTTYDRSDVR